MCLKTDGECNVVPVAKDSLRGTTWSKSYTEVLWNATRPTLVTSRKSPSEKRDILVLGDCQVPEEHLSCSSNGTQVLPGIYP
ncbi:hypothetical protein MRX96_000677 [Rhipicephalus microplus]